MIFFTFVRTILIKPSKYAFFAAKILFMPNSRNIIREMLLQEHSKAQMLRIVESIEIDNSLFQELIDIFFGNDSRLVQRSAWALKHLAIQSPRFIVPYLDKLVANLKKDNLHDATIRNSLRILEDMKIPSRLHGEIVTICFDYLEDFHTAIAIKCFSMTIIWNICEYEPDLSNELKLLLEDQMQYQSAGFKSRGKKILKAIHKKESSTSSD